MIEGRKAHAVLDDGEIDYIEWSADWGPNDSEGIAESIAADRGEPYTHGEVIIIRAGQLAARDAANVEAGIKSMLTTVLPLLGGCGHCEYDEAEGDLIDHCPTCCHRVTAAVCDIITPPTTTLAALLKEERAKVLKEVKEQVDEACALTIAGEPKGVAEKNLYALSLYVNRELAAIDGEV